MKRKDIMTIPVPEYHNHEEYQIRYKKLQEIKELGIDPYPHKFTPTITTNTLLEKYQDKEVGHSDDAAASATEQVTIAGRLVLFRAMGKNAFAHIQDASGRIQVMFNRDLTTIEGYDPSKSETPLSHIKFIEKKIDLGDYIGIEGNIFRTQKGELTIFAKKVTLLCKTLLPLPDKHAGLVDKELRYRKRWLDLISNSEVKNRFIIRSKILHCMRNVFADSNFMEVETPILQTTYGGALAKPFTTMLNSLHQDMYLRISLEIALKKLIVGGFDRIFEIGKVFRNESIDKTHNPEFTLIEAYAAYWDYNDLMNFVESLVETIALELFGTTQIPFETPTGIEMLNVAAPWKRISMKDSIKEYANIDVDSLDDTQIRDLLKKETDLEKKEIDKATRGSLIAFLFEEFVESFLIQPHHITDHPIETTPLCKLHRDPEKKKERLVERFETFVLGKELVNAYSELNDPVLQRTLLEEQALKRLGGDEEASPMDEEFIEAICQGMPPTGGFGMGIDRLVMILTQAISIRDVIYFPLMRIEE